VPVIRGMIKQTGKSSLYNSQNAGKGTIRVPKAAEIVSSEIRRQIVRREIAVGSLLAPESALMERFGVSRPTLREAVRILESEGLISISRGARGGSVVLQPDIGLATRYLSLVLQVNGTSLAEIYRVHALIEPVAARLVAESRNPVAAAELRRCFSAGMAHFDNDFQFGTDTARFRNKLIQLAGIPTLTLLTTVLNDILERCWASLTATAGKETDNRKAKRLGLASLAKLIEYIEKGDGPGAEAHWRKHTASVEKAMGKWLESKSVVDLLEG